MYVFPHIPVSIKSISKRSLVQGIGINDADYTDQYAPLTRGK